MKHPFFERKLNNIIHYFLGGYFYVFFLILFFSPKVYAVTYYNENTQNITMYVGEEVGLYYSQNAYNSRHYKREYTRWTYSDTYFEGIEESSNQYPLKLTAKTECTNVNVSFSYSYSYKYYPSGSTTLRTDYYRGTITWKITVIPRPSPEQVTLNDKIVDIPVNSQHKLSAAISPKEAIQSVIWSSNAPDIASVDENGLVTGVGIGDAVITVTSNIDNTVYNTCNVHVGTTDVQSINIPTDLSLHYGNTTKIIPTISPSYAVYDLEWQSSNENVVTVDQQGNITGVGPGEADVTVTDNLAGVQGTCIVTVNFDVGDTFKANISNSTGTVSMTFMLTDWENRYVSLGDGTNAAIATATTGRIDIPETIVGPGNLTYTIMSIGNKAFYSSKISAVSIPQNITTIGDNAFYLCSSLTSVTVESTEPLAINSNCFSIKAGATLYVPKGSYEIYKETDVWKDFGTIVEPPHSVGDTFAASITAGSSTTTATFIVIDAANKFVSVGNGEEPAIADYTSGQVVVPSTVTGYDGQTYQVKQISDAAFFDCYEITSIELPSDITAIGRLAFYDCAGLKSFTIPASVTAIGEEAFNNCYNLTSINIPSSVASLGSSAFYGCSKLTTVTVNSIEPVAIDNECFTNAANATLNIPKGSYRNYASADNWKNFKTIKEPAHSLGDTFTASITAGGTKIDATFKVTNTSNKYVSIGDGEDSAIDIFTSGNIVIPSTVEGYDGQTYTVKTVADATFFGCENVTSISLPTSITTIGNSAFLRCYNLANISIPTSVTNDGNEAFFYCENLASISIPKNVTTIGTKAFKDCNILTSVTAGWNTPITIDSECFSNAANATLNVPYGSKEKYEAAIGWKQFKNIVEMAPKDGDMFTALTAEGVKMTFTIINANAKTCKVGNGSNSSVPTGTNGLVTIPSSVNGFAVTQIAYYAFSNCSQITETVIPTSVTSIGSYAFSRCNNLNSVTVEWDEPITIGSNCFSNAPNATLYVPIGTNYEYSVATGWKDFGQIVNKSDNILFARDFEEAPLGGRILLPIELNNSDLVAGCSFTLKLPEGMSFVTNNAGQATYRINENRISSNSYSIIPSVISDRECQFRVMPTTPTATINGSDGSLFSVKVDVGQNLTTGDYYAQMSDVMLSIKKDEALPFSLYLLDQSSKVAVSRFVAGDVNNDGGDKPDLTDAIIIVYKYFNNSLEINDNFADLNADGEIDLTDAIIVVYKSFGNDKMAASKAMKIIIPD